MLASHKGTIFTQGRRQTDKKGGPSTQGHQQGTTERALTNEGTQSGDIDVPVRYSLLRGIARVIREYHSVHGHYQTRQRSSTQLRSSRKDQ